MKSKDRPEGQRRPPVGHAYATDARLGQRYRDEQTGIEGTAIAVTFFQHGCERVALEAVINGEIKEYGFDAPRLTHIESGHRARSVRTGGPDRVDTTRPGPVRR